MNIYKNLQQQIKLICEAYIGTLGLEHISVDAVNADPPKDPSHGDIATNAAMVLAKPVGKKPRDVAEALVPKIEALDGVAKVDIAGPGFINITLKPSIWQSLIPEILANPEAYGRSQIGAGQKVNVEYVSVNPTGPMHIGHTRHIYGDALASLLEKAGYDVTREYYINDAGSQIDKLIDSAHLRYCEASGQKIGEIPEGLYPGDYLVPVGQELYKKYGDSLLDEAPETYRPQIRDMVVNAMMDMIRADLELMGIRHNVFTSEAALVAAGRTEAALAILEAKGLIYNGVLEPPKGKAPPEDWEPTEQTLFKSTAYGDDLDRAVKKSDGSWTYLAPDMAYHHDKIQRGFTRLIDVMGADHGGYVKRITAAVRALGEDKATLEVKLCQMVKFMRGGEPLKMSKRAGTFITAREVVEEVGKDVLRFIMLTRKNDAPLEFDFEKVKEQTKDNPVFYVQYAHARCKSVLRHADKDFAQSVKLAAKPTTQLLAKLSSPEELTLLKTMAEWPRIVESAALAAEPHRIAFYLHDLASSFHSLWNKGQDNLTLRFLQKDDIEETAAKIAMVRAFATTVASGLNTLGVQPLEEL